MYKENDLWTVSNVWTVQSQYLNAILHMYSSIKGASIAVLQYVCIFFNSNVIIKSTYV